jgi:hypothetical protein
MIVHDPTAYEIHFFAIPTILEGKILHSVCDYLNAATSQLAKIVGNDAPHRILNVEDFEEEFSDRLTGIEPAAIPSGATLELDIRTMDDTVMLRTSALHRGSFQLPHVKNLDFSAKSPPDQKEVPNYLGAFRLLYIETDEQDPSQRAEVGKAVAEVRGWTWLAEAEPIIIPIGTMLFGVQPRSPQERHEEATLDLIFIGGRNSAEMAERYAAHPFLLKLPELALCHLKVRNSVANIRGNWLGKLTERERELRGLLPRPVDLEQKPIPLLDRNARITFCQAELIDAVVHLQTELRTMRINRDVFASAASQPFPGAVDQLKNLLIERWMRGTELQTENNIGYSEGTLRLAETHFKSIEASAQADQARELSNINWWVIVGVVATGFGILVAMLGVYLNWKSVPPPPAP